MYNNKTLYEDYILGNAQSYKNTPDKLIYKHYLKTGKEAYSIKETLCRRLHDHSISDALYDFISKYEEKKIVAVMGGHSISRKSENYSVVAKISKYLTEKSYLMVSGGGPGAMEATHLGAWFAGYHNSDLNKGLKIISDADSYKDPNWLDVAFKVINKYPKKNYESLGIPTWLYGHEPATPFASQIAKYFANSVREEGLLSIAKGGIIFSPGSAGTMQEIFQEAAQNHYLSFGYASPMIFLNSEYWTKKIPAYPLIKQMFTEGKYKNLILSLCNTKEEVITEIQNFT